MARVEAPGIAGYSEVKIFSSGNRWQRDGGEVLDTCIERHWRCVQRLKPARRPVRCAARAAH
jgi:hypothetical protein